jgi:hypothetical protein
MPFIPGLLDPATNSKLAPNIPAQTLYDVQDDGLSMARPWAGHYVLLNPDYRSNVGMLSKRYMIREQKTISQAFRS